MKFKMKMPYEDKIIPDQLKKLRLYRGYKKQSIICKELKHSRQAGCTPSSGAERNDQVWSLWELGRRTPSAAQLTRLANHFFIKIEYFFTPGALPGDFDLLIKNKTEQKAVHEAG